MKNCLRTAACAIMALASFCAAAQDMPAWASKGTKSINAERSNDTYELREFNTHDVDKSRLHRERFEPLFMYVRENFSAQPEGLTIDSVAENGVLTYIVGYTDKNDGSRHTMQARRVDEFSEYTDFESNDYQWELYQLYAIGRPDIVPQFDEFELTRSYRGKALAMSIVPGWGQLYKGQTTKGLVIMGGEAVLLATGIIFEHQRHKGAQHGESWRTKTIGYRNVRNVAFGGAIALYIYNLIDAATSQGARRVVVKKSKGENLSMHAIAIPGGAAVGVSYTF